MVVANASGTLLLERPLDAPEYAEWSLPCAPSTEPAEDPGAEGVGDESRSIGSLLRAPGLAVLAAVFLLEGYRWLGVIHVGGTEAGSLLFGTVGLALAAMAAPWVASPRTSGRDREATVFAALIAATALATVVTTGSALVVGGPLWRSLAGSADLVLAATASAAVVTGERARQSRERTVPVGVAPTR